MGPKPIALVFYMDQHPQGRVKTPKYAPIFLPSFVIGNFQPKEIAIIFALQGFGASSNWVQITYENLSVATKVTKGALPLLISKLEDLGIVEKARTYSEETGKPIYHFRLYIWEWAENYTRPGSNS